MRRKILLTLAVVILGAGAAFWWWSRPLPVLNVVTWPGAYGRAQAAAQMQAYGTAKRVDVRIQQWAENGTLDELQHAIAAHRAGDVVDLELPVAIAACKAGLLETIDAATLPAGADGVAAAQDFHKGMTGRCFVASAIYAQMLVCAAPCDTGKGLAGVFAAAAEGRKLALQRGAKINLELALLADGVPPGDVYPLLSTDAGVARAFAKLASIKANIVWWTSSAQSLALLKRGEVAAATALTADVQAAGGAVTPFVLQFYEADVLAIPKGGARLPMAQDYVRYATGSAPLANMVRFSPYPPPRRSAMALVRQLPAGQPRDFVVNAPDPADGFAVNDAWWADHGPALEARFRDWAATP